MVCVSPVFGVLVPSMDAPCPPAPFCQPLSLNALPATVTPWHVEPRQTGSPGWGDSTPSFTQNREATTSLTGSTGAAPCLGLSLGGRQGGGGQEVHQKRGRPRARHASVSRQAVNLRTHTCKVDGSRVVVKEWGGGSFCPGGGQGGARCQVCGRVWVRGNGTRGVCAHQATENVQQDQDRKEALGVLNDANHDRDISGCAIV